MTSSELQLVHLSDLHIGLASGTGEGSWGTAVERLRTARGRIWGLEQADADNLERLAESAARDKVAKRPGGQVHCIASGDLTAQGGKREFGRAFDYLRKTLSTPKAGLAYGEVGGYSHVLGNHDVWRSDLDRATRKGFRRTEEVREIVRKRGEAHSPRGLGDPYHVDLGPLRVRVYLLESWRLNLRNVFASGHVSSNQLEQLEKDVNADKGRDKKAGVRACLRIAVLHHPVKPKPKGWLGWVPFVFHLSNAKDVEQALRKLKFGLVLCGHEHAQRPDKDEDADGLWQGVAGTGSQSRHDNFFLVYRITAPAEGARLGSTITVTVEHHECKRGSASFKIVDVKPHDVTVAKL